MEAAGGANATQYQVIDRVDALPNGMKSVISFGSSATTNAERLAGRIGEKVERLDSKTSIQVRPGFGSLGEPIPVGEIGSRSVVFGIPENNLSILQNPAFRSELEQIRAEAQNVEVIVVPVRNWIVAGEATGGE